MGWPVSHRAPLRPVHPEDGPEHAQEQGQLQDDQEQEVDTAEQGPACGGHNDRSELPPRTPPPSSAPPRLWVPITHVRAGLGPQADIGLHLPDSLPSSLFSSLGALLGGK